MNNLKQYVQGNMCWPDCNNTCKTSVDRVQIVPAQGKSLCPVLGALHIDRIEKREVMVR